MKNNWTVEEKLKLYKMYLEEGPKWSKFSEELDKTWDSVRNVFRRTDWDSFISENDITTEELLSGEIKEKESKDKYRNESVNNLINQKKENIIKEHEMRRMNEHLASLAKKEAVLDKLMASIQKVPNISPTDINIITHPDRIKPQESVALFSDSHIGLGVKPEEVGYLGDYGIPQFKQRVDTYTQSVCEITELHRKQHRLDTINICFLGDIVHGQNDVGKWGFLHQEQNVVDQVFEACQQIRIMILTLRQIYKKVKINTVFGNHGRIARKGVEKDFVNWDYIIYKWIESSLSKQEGIEFNIPRSNFLVVDVMSKKLLLTHGSQAKSWSGVPWYGLNRMESRFRSLIDRSKNINKMYEEMEEKGINKKQPEDIVKYIFNYVRSFDYLITGHFHTLGEVETISGGRIILNSSFIGGDDYSINELITAGAPAQKFFGINQDRKTWSYDIELVRSDR